MTTVIVLFILIVIYIFPTLVAVRLNHSKKDSIAIINIFLGWTFVAWVIALAWALSEKNNHECK